MKPITIFSWGYYGWGNAPDQCLKLNCCRRTEPTLPAGTINAELGLPDDQPTEALFEFLDGH